VADEATHGLLHRLAVAGDPSAGRTGVKARLPVGRHIQRMQKALTQIRSSGECAERWSGMTDKDHSGHLAGEGDRFRARGALLRFVIRSGCKNA
jgi:hypothetical protein